MGSRSGWLTTSKRWRYGVPYGWQAKGERVCLPTARSKRQSVFGLLSHDNRLSTYNTGQKIDSEFAIDSVDEFTATQPEKVTLLVLDNASIHQAKIFQAARQRWGSPYRAATL